jgi:hypothetical protein
MSISGNSEPIDATDILVDTGDLGFAAGSA